MNTENEFDLSSILNRVVRHLGGLSGLDDEEASDGLLMHRPDSIRTISEQALQPIVRRRWMRQEPFTEETEG